MLLNWPQLHHLWTGTKSRQFLPFQRVTDARARMLAEILALGRSCVSATPQLKTRMVSQGILWSEQGI